MAAPKGNRFAAGNNGGQPPRYETPQELWDKAAEYFELVTSTTGKCKAGIAGLCFHLGFESRQSLYDQEKRSEEFSYTVKKIKIFIESGWEENLHGFAWAGAAFALKNMNPEHWKDEVTQNQNQTITQVTIEEKTREA
jgi:hypothetical protein